MPSIVQFIHPGAEHEPDKKDLTYKGWNHREHKRKFLKSKGSYVDKGILGPKEVNLVFWGEWEPPTNVHGILTRPTDIHTNRPIRLFPKWLHSRILDVEVPEYCGGLQNTDPYVFDGPFRYFTCHQSKNMNPTSLTKLDNGSLIIFGSNCKENNLSFFQIDTVFVVRKGVPYDASDDNNDLFLTHTTQEYYEKSYLRAFPVRHFYPLKLRLYEGVEFEDKDKFNGMYSFVPSKVYNNEIQGFPRIKIQSENFIEDYQEHINDHPSKKFKINNSFISNKLNINYKETKDVDSRIIKKVWQKIVERSRSVDCVEGVKFTRQT